MSVVVELGELGARIAEFGDRAYLVSVGDDRKAHVVSTAVAWCDGVIEAGAGRRTRANLATQHAVTLLWPPARGGRFSLIVDAEADEPAEGDEGPITLRPHRAVLHRS
jgi:hypothetical protein